MRHFTNESNVHLVSRLIFLESKVVFLSSLTSFRQLQSQNRQLKLVVSALTLRKEQRLTSPSSSPTKPCPPPSAWLSPGRVQAHHKHDAGVEDHVQALLFSGSCAGSFSTDEMFVPDRSDGIAPAAAQPPLPDVSSAHTPSPVPPPNTPMTEAATAPHLTPMRIQLLDQLLDLEEEEEGEEEQGDSESGGQGAALHMYSNPMFSSSGDWDAVHSAAKEDAKNLPNEEMETEASLLQTPQPMTPADDGYIQPAPALRAQESTSSLPGQAVPSQEPQPPETDETAAEAITQEKTPSSSSSLSAVAAAAAPGVGLASVSDAPFPESTPPLPLQSHLELDQATALSQQPNTHQPTQPSDPEAHQAPAAAAAAAEMSKPPAEHQAALALALHSHPDQEAEASAEEALPLEPFPHPPNQAQYAEDASPAGIGTAAVGTRTAAAASLPAPQPTFQAQIDAEDAPSAGTRIPPEGAGTAAGDTRAAASLPDPQPTTQAQLGAEDAPPAGIRLPPAGTGTAEGYTRIAARLPTPMPPSAAVETATAAATALISATWSRILSGSAALQSLAQGLPSKPASHWNHSEHFAAHVRGSLGQDQWSCPSHASDRGHGPADTPDLVQARVQTAEIIEGSSIDALSALPRAAVGLWGQPHEEPQAGVLYEHSTQTQQQQQQQQQQQHEEPQSGALSECRPCGPEFAEGAADSVRGSVLGSIYSRFKASHGHALLHASEGVGTAWQHPAQLERQPNRVPHIPSAPVPPGKSFQDLGFASALEVALSLKPLYPDHAKPNLLQTSPPASTNSWQSQSPAPTKHSRHKLPNTPLQASPTSPTASAAAQHAHSPQESSRNTRSSLPPRPPAQPTRGQEAAAVRELDFISSDARSNNSGRGAAALRPNLISSDAHSSSSSSRKSAAVQRPGSSPDTRTRAGSSRAYSAAVRPQVASNSSSNKQNSRSFSAPRASMADTGNSLAPEKAETGELALYRKRSKQPKAGLGCHIQPSLQLPELEGMLQQDGEGQQMSAQEGQEQHQQQQNGPSLPPQSSLHRNAHRPLHHKSRIPRPPSSGSSSTQQLAIPRHPSGSPCRLAQPAILTLPADAGSLCSLSRWESTDDLEGPAPGAWRLESQRNSDPDIMAWLQSSLAM